MLTFSSLETLFPRDQIQHDFTSEQEFAGSPISSSYVLRDARRRFGMLALRNLHRDVVALPGNGKLKIYAHNVAMTQVDIAELKSRLSKCLRAVRRGETIFVLDRDTIIRMVNGSDPFSNSGQRKWARRLHPAAPC
jgi:hypothetical protein